MNLKIVQETLREAHACNGPEAVELMAHMTLVSRQVENILNALRPKAHAHMDSLSAKEQEALTARLFEKYPELPEVVPEVERPQPNTGSAPPPPPPAPEPREYSAMERERARTEFGIELP